MTKRRCTGEGQRAVYQPRNIHPHCPACGRDLSVQGKRQKVRGGIVGRHYAEATT